MHNIHSKYFVIVFYYGIKELYPKNIADIIIKVSLQLKKIVLELKLK